MSLESNSVGAAGVGQRFASALGWLAVAIGLVLFIARLHILWRDPYQLGRVWQTIDISRESQRVGGSPWKTELSPMAGGSVPAPFLQEFPAEQYGAWALTRVLHFPLAHSTQLVASATAVLCVLK
jgi:hypothetical protein